MLQKLLICLLLCVHVINTQAQQKNKKNNVIIILVDDLGWADLSSYGSTFYETPNLDKLAKEGIRFTQNYATCPVCSPTRASLLTGKYPVKTGVTDWIKGRQENGKAKPYEKLIGPATAYELALKETTIAEYAVQNGYKTMIAGKWHLGEEEAFWPEKQGFQLNSGGWSKGGPNGKINDSTGGYFTPYKNPSLKDGPKGEYLTDRLTNESINFIKQNKNSPFLLYYAMYAVHNPLQAPKPLIEKYIQKQKAIEEKEVFKKDEKWMQFEKDWKRRTIQNNAVYAAMIENMDWNIGKLIETLKQQRIEENTLIIFTSDNGGLSTAEGSPTVNGNLRAGKGWLYEGGIRVPLIMYSKKSALSGLTSNIKTTTADLFPTIAKTINNNYQKTIDIDGDDIFSLLKQTKNIERELYWHYPHYSNQGGKPSAAIRKGNYKLIYYYETDDVELFDLSIDISEKNNIASLNKKEAIALKQTLFCWLEKNKAKVPIKNPMYNAN